MIKTTKIKQAGNLQLTRNDKSPNPLQCYNGVGTIHNNNEWVKWGRDIPFRIIDMSNMSIIEDKYIEIMQVTEFDETAYIVDEQ